MKKEEPNNELVRTPYELTLPEFVSVRISSMLFVIFLEFFMFIYEPQFMADSVVDYPYLDSFIQKK
ncbi:MAG: hypothetical protein Q8M95_11735 [Candidatus Methanoperedens sp.]|nr:hypothetical protein [Candidatus Methanoperedens sp.]